MTYSENCEKLIKHFERLKLKAYICPAGVLTIGWGHTKTVTKGMQINEIVAQKLLNADLYHCMQILRMHLKKEVSQGVYDALISQAFNMTYRSTKKLIEYVNNDIEVYKKKILLYCKDINGVTLKGLRIRRWAELHLAEGKSWDEILPEVQKMQRMR